MTVLGRKSRRPWIARRPRPNGEPFQDLGGQHEAGDDQGRKELPNRQSREKSDGHREFHRHLSFDDVLEGFLENGISADQGGRDADYTDVRKRLPKPKPDRRRSQGHKSNADEFSPLHSLPVFFVLSARVRFVQFWGIPLLSEMGSAGWGLFDDGRRAHNDIPSVCGLERGHFKYDFTISITSLSTTAQ